MQNHHRGRWAGATAVVAVWLSAGLHSPAADPDGFDLRGPAPVKGQVFRSRVVLKLTDTDVAMKVAGQTLKLKQTMTVTTDEEEKVLAVDGRQVTRSQAKILKDEAKTVVEIGDQKKADDKPGELQGEVILSTRTADGKWKHALVDTTPTDKQKKELDKRLGPECDDDLMPAGRVAPGHTWTVGADKMRKFLGNAFSEVTGTLKMKFARVEDVNGEKCAVIEARGPITGKLKDEDGDLDFQMEMTATAWRSLKSGVDVKDTITGPIKMSGSQTLDGTPVEVVLKGTLTANGTTTVK